MDTYYVKCKSTVFRNAPKWLATLLLIAVGSAVAFAAPSNDLAKGQHQHHTYIHTYIHNNID